MEKYTTKLINYYSNEIEELDFENKSIIGILDLKKFQNLKILNCHNNIIANLKNIPNTLIKLNYSHNKIVHLNLKI